MPPDFKHRDPASAAFWDERFDRDFTPWDARGVPAALKTFVSAEGTLRATLIPGCGAAHEAGWLDARGWPVCAIDFSPSAVAQARELLGTRAEVVMQADFFAFTPPFVPEIVYERAFLCALPRTLWPAYAARMAELLPPGGRLAGFFFVRETPGGPPFGISPDALQALLGPAFVCEADEAVTPSVPVFEGGERWMVWRRR
ncbi:thiopurine S-methyltransferase [Pandoraea terrae]|uniref:Thiopurine S-methyltransferase n=1 Tax=Pandoraea terrae TaxID=1537710 RepID=A0A5E4TZS7_9BURK|nr:methyltransferase domain-containing protein [Pandoraea terrae]VVD92773.1 thiopurine S-methyltransferase [Pandoraea terrae]